MVYLQHKAHRIMLGPTVQLVRTQLSSGSGEDTPKRAHRKERSNSIPIVNTDGPVGCRKVSSSSISIGRTSSTLHACGISFDEGGNFLAPTEKISVRHDANHQFNCELCIHRESSRIVVRDVPIRTPASLSYMGRPYSRRGKRTSQRNRSKPNIFTCTHMSAPAPSQNPHLTIRVSLFQLQTPSLLKVNSAGWWSSHPTHHPLQPHIRRQSPRTSSHNSAE